METIGAEVLSHFSFLIDKQCVEIEREAHGLNVDGDSAGDDFESVLIEIDQAADDGRRVLDLSADDYEKIEAA